jgi:hypothetical protein
VGGEWGRVSDRNGELDVSVFLGGFFLALLSLFFVSLFPTVLVGWFVASIVNGVIPPLHPHLPVPRSHSPMDYIGASNTPIPQSSHMQAPAS